MQKTIQFCFLTGVFLLGLWFTVIQVMGLDLAWIPGDLGDVRFNNYVLEHFYQWIQAPVNNFWDASFFYPFPNAIAFSDNLLGSAPFYAVFRGLSLDRETAYQSWYILGFLLNYLAAAYVLLRMKFKLLAVAAGAFFFGFGLPLIFQENHPQLLYRFAVPLSCYFLWLFSEKADLKALAVIPLLTVWQLYMGIYNGIFLFFMLAVMWVLIPVLSTSQSVKSRLFFWPVLIQKAWNSASISKKILTPISWLIGISGLLILLLPYYEVTKTYGFGRTWETVVTMLPQWRSFFLADASIIWGRISTAFQGVPMRHEHQLFPGLAVILLLSIGFMWHPKSELRRIAFIHFVTALILIACSIYIQKFSVYRLIWSIPGINSLRSITRIMLVLMWPLGLFAAYGMNGLLQVKKSRFNWVIQLVAILLLVLLITESSLINHGRFNKQAAQNRVTALIQKVQPNILSTSTLIFGFPPNPDWFADELDAMIAAQDLHVPVMNGYSGNFPPGYGSTTSCARLPIRTLTYLRFSKSTDSDRYFDLINHVVPIGFSDCNTHWWNHLPTVTYQVGIFPDSIFTHVQLKILSAEIIGTQLQFRIEVSNQSEFNLAANSSTNNQFKISWHFLNQNDRQPVSGFDLLKPLDFDIPPGNKSVLSIIGDLPPFPGSYILEAAALQERIGMFSERGGENALSDFLIVRDDQQKIAIRSNE